MLISDQTNKLGAFYTTQHYSTTVKRTFKHL